LKIFEIPFSLPYLNNNKVIESELLSIVRSKWLTQGPITERFESEIGIWLGSSKVFACNNGTSAIFLAYKALELSPGDEVLCPAYCYQAAANVAVTLNLNVKFYDVNPHTFIGDVDQVRKLIGKKTKAIVLVGTYGNVPNFSEFRVLADKFNLKIIEDAAESYGSTILEGNSGMLGDVSTLSFHATKLLTTGEGGAVSCSTNSQIDLIKLWRSHGILNEPYLHQVPGLNFRLSALCASLGLSQIPDLDKSIQSRQKIYSLYRSLLDQNDRYHFQKLNPMTRFIPWGFPLVLKQNRNLVSTIMETYGIQTRKGFYDNSKLKYFKDKTSHQNSKFLSNHILVLPLFSEMSEEQVIKVVERFHSAINKAAMN
jgi:perosamine synthetase